jgi:hypothetical protein
MSCYMMMLWIRVLFHHYKSGNAVIRFGGDKRMASLVSKDA